MPMVLESSAVRFWTPALTSSATVDLLTPITGAIARVLKPAAFNVRARLSRPALVRRSKLVSETILNVGVPVGIAERFPVPTLVRRGDLGDHLFGAVGDGDLPARTRSSRYAEDHEAGDRDGPQPCAPCPRLPRSCRVRDAARPYSPFTRADILRTRSTSRPSTMC